MSAERQQSPLRYLRTYLLGGREGPLSETSGERQTTAESAPDRPRHVTTRLQCVVSRRAGAGARGAKGRGGVGWGLVEAVQDWIATNECGRLK